METTSIPPAAGFCTRLHRRLFNWRAARRLLIALAGLVTLIALFYTVENWRGRRAWEECKRELEARGMALDWSAFTPAPVPDDQNIFKAPHMTDWFLRNQAQGYSNELSSLMNPAGLSDLALKRSARLVAEIKVVSLDAIVSPSDADVVLRFDRPMLTLAAAGPVHRPALPIIPLIVMDDVPWQEAITNLARQADLKYRLDPAIWWGRPGPDGRPVPQPHISIRWEKLTARQALLALLNNYGLALVENTPEGIAHIILNDPAGSDVRMEPSLREQLGQLIQRAFGLNTNTPGLDSSLGLLLIVQPPDPGRPARLVVRSDTIPTSEEIAKFFPATGPGRSRTSRFRYDVQPAGNNSFRVSMTPPGTCLTADYLAWSDPYTNAFDSIRAALQRPGARIDCDYRQPSTLLMQNFVNCRRVAQTLSDRVRCNLLLGRPEAALHDLALLHDLHRLLECQPVTLVAAMVNVAITGLYVDTIAQGLRLQAWREPELAAIQSQLAEVRLLPSVYDAFKLEAALSCNSLETITPDTFARGFLSDPQNGWKELTFWQKRTNPRYLLVAVMPRGWVYQNMVVSARLNQQLAASFDFTNQLVLPERANALNDERQTEAGRFSPYSFIGANTANFIRATQTFARNQTLANEALLACALQRYHLARGEFPDSLEALKPQFLAALPPDLIGGQPLKYRRTDDGQFLLYSIGWNQTDDGGTNHMESNQAMLEQGDWVWRQTPR